MSNTENNTIRTNGNGKPFGWLAFAPKGSAYYNNKFPHHVLRKSGSGWHVYNTETHSVVTEGQTMVEAVTNLMNNQEVAK